MSTKELLQIYYKGFAAKAGWESVIADDFRFVGGDMMNQTPVVGKQAYAGIIERFSRLFATMRVKEMIVEGDKACVIGNYDYVFPGETKVNGDVAEIWEAKNGKLASLTIFFDTQAFQTLTKK